jgi:hypothetical protein
VSDILDMIPGWFTYPKLYAKAVADAPDGCAFAEVGCFLGRSAGYLAREIKRSGKTITLYCIDSWDNFTTGPDLAHQTAAMVMAGFAEDSLYGAFLAHMNILGVRDIIRPLKLRSPGAAQNFLNGSLQFIFIDAAHDYGSVTADLKAWWPKVAPGGRMAGHDYNNNHPEVDRAVQDFFGANCGVGEECWSTDKV